MTDEPVQDVRVRGSLLAEYALDPAVVRCLRQAGKLFLANLLLDLALVLIALRLHTPLPLTGIPLMAGLSLLAAGGMCPPGKEAGLFWGLQAYEWRHRRMGQYPEGLVIREEGKETLYPWEQVAFIRHDRFRAYPWMRQEGLFLQKARRLTLVFKDGRRLALSDVLARVEDLALRVQAQVYGARLRAALGDYERGGTVAFGHLSVTRLGIEANESALPWERVGEVRLERERLVVRARGSWRPFWMEQVGRVPDFPVLLALLEQYQPWLAWGLSDGLPLDAAAELWQRTTELRGQAPLPPGAFVPADSPVPPSSAPPDHVGRPARTDADFFVPAPAEIGPVVSASTTLRQGDRPMRMVPRVGLILVVVLAGWALGALVLSRLGVRSLGWRVVVELVAPLGVGLLTWRVTAFLHTCTYVGIEGVARFRCWGRRGRVTTREVFLFRQAEELRTSLTVYPRNNGQSTSYEFTWTGPEQKSLFRIAGSYFSYKEPPPPSDEYHFAEAAEVAWSVFLLERVREQLAARGWVQFNLDRGEWVRVGPGFLEFGLRGSQAQRCRVEDLELPEVLPEDRVLRFRRRDARVGWFRWGDTFEVPCARLANTQLFLFLLRTLVLYGSTEDPETARCRAFLRVLEEAVSQRWRGGPHDARVSAFIQASLGPNASQHLLRVHLESPSPPCRDRREG